MKFDLHSHTIYSSQTKWLFESIIKPADLIKLAIKQGLDGIAITDHETFKGVLECLKIVRQKKSDLMIIPGVEISSKDGHILGLGIEEWNTDKKMTAEEAIDSIKNFGGIAIAAHPLVSSISRRGLGKLIENLDIDGVEVLNYRTSKNDNRQALRIAEKLNLGVTAGSDAHMLSDIGNVWTFSESDDIIESVLKRETKVFGEEMSKFQRHFYQLNKIVRSFGLL